MDGIAAPPAAEGGGEGASPWLDLAGFHGRLERLLVLARSHRVDLACIALPHLVDQLIAALQDAGSRTPLGLQAEWVVMAAWLLQMRSQLLLPADAAAQDAANREAARLRRGLARLDAVQAAARWLDEQPRLGRDVFPRGRPELMGIGTAALHQVDVVEFLWASLVLFDDDLPPPGTAASYRPAWLDLHAIPDARDRILRRMAGRADTCRLDQLLPDAPGLGSPHDTGLRGRSRWTSTFVASLELAKQGEVALDQQEALQPHPGRQRRQDASHDAGRWRCLTGRPARSAPSSGTLGSRGAGGRAAVMVSSLQNGQREPAPSARAATSSLAMPWFGPPCAATRSIAGQSKCTLSVVRSQRAAGATGTDALASGTDWAASLTSLHRARGWCGPPRVRRQLDTSARSFLGRMQSVGFEAG